MADNSSIQTIDDFIRYGNTSDYTVPNTSYLRRYDDLVIHDKFAYSKYHSLIMGMSSFVILSDEEQQVFKYRPDLLSYRLYNTPNLSHLILYLNSCSEYEFDKKRVRVIPLGYIQQLFNLIMSHESEPMKKNNKEAER